MNDGGEVALAVKLADRYTNHLWLGKARPAEFDRHRELLAKYEREMPELGPSCSRPLPVIETIDLPAP